MIKISDSRVYSNVEGVNTIKMINGDMVSPPFFVLPHLVTRVFILGIVISFLVQNDLTSSKSDSQP
jgi:hypothetical protein